MNIDFPENMQIKDTIVGNHIQFFINTLKKGLIFLPIHDFIQAFNAIPH